MRTQEGPRDLLNSKYINDENDGGGLVMMTMMMYFSEHNLHLSVACLYFTLFDVH